MNYITLVINLDDSTERLQSVDEQLKQHGITYQRVPAFDGRKMRPCDCKLYNEKKAISYMGRSLLGGEIGCYLSHLNCAKKFLESKAAYALVLEDDVKINCNLKKITESILQWVENEKNQHWDLINIGAKELKISTELNEFSDGNEAFKLHHAHYFPVRTTGLIWSRNGAKNFINRSKEIFAPVDNYFRYYFSKTNSGLAFSPPLVQTTGAESEIDSDKLIKKRRTIKRSHFYFYIKQKRLLLEKLGAVKNKLIFEKSRRSA
mgnify:CR=1 FL=1